MKISIFNVAFWILTAGAWQGAADAAQLTQQDYAHYLDNMLIACENKDLNACIHHTNEWNNALKEVHAIEIAMTSQFKQDLLNAFIPLSDEDKTKAYEKVLSVEREHALYEQLRMRRDLAARMGCMFRMELGITPEEEVVIVPMDEIFTVYDLLLWLDAVTALTTDPGINATRVEEGLAQLVNMLGAAIKESPTMIIPLAPIMQERLRVSRFDHVGALTAQERVEYSQSNLPQFLNQYQMLRDQIQEAYTRVVAVPICAAWKHLLILYNNAATRLNDQGDGSLWEQLVTLPR